MAINKLTSVPRNHQKHLNQQVRQACIEMEAEIESELPEDAFFNIFHISNQLEKKGYKLARQYNEEVCNGITLLIVQTPQQIAVFPAICSKEDTYSRLDGRKEVVSRAYQTIVKGVQQPTTIYFQSKQDLLFEGQEENEKTYNRAVINRFIKDFVNTKAKKPVTKLEVSREQVLDAEEALLVLLKKSNPNALDYRLVYKHKDSYRSPKVKHGQYETKDSEVNSTTLYVVAAKTEHNAQFEQSVIDEFEKQAGALTVSVKRYRFDDNNRLNARWYAIQKMAKKLKS